MIRNPTRRAVLAGSAAALGLARTARAATSFRFLTNWYAQAEHAGFYQAQARGFYHEAGLDVVIEHGGPQINNLQLLLAGRYDMAISSLDEALRCTERDMPVVTVATTFQKSLSGLLTHPDIRTIADLKGHTILLSTEGRETFWPWMRDHYGFSDSQIRPYSYNLQPFLVGPGLAVQSYATSEPYALRQRNVPYRFFLIDDITVPNYGNPVVVTRDTLTTRRDETARFLRASMRGWADWLTGDPSPGNTAIRAANPQMAEDQILWSRQQFRALNTLGPTGTMFGTITAERARAVRDFMVATQQVSAAAPWERAFDLSFTKDMDVPFTG